MVILRFQYSKTKPKLFDRHAERSDIQKIYLSSEAIWVYLERKKLLYLHYAKWIAAGESVVTPSLVFDFQVISYNVDISPNTNQNTM